MDSKTLVKVLKKVVREEVRIIIKEELSEILQTGLQSTINEMSLTEIAAPVPQVTKSKKNKIEFKKNKFSDILNETDSLREQSPYGAMMNQPLNENITMTSADAQGFGAVREKMRTQMMGIETTSVIADPETGKSLQVDPVVAKAMTRDYSALMKAMDKKRGKG
tara:strand:+ start:1378 stop:1869 length:492 start_codon:yes stop_codon:yes gene_type:complete